MTAQRKKPGRQQAGRFRRWGLLSLAAVVVAGVFFGGGWFVRTRFIPSPGSLLAKGSLSSTERTDGLSTTLHTETVDAVGGSMAHGWVDPQNDSYLRRAFAARTSSTDTTYQYVDRTVVGDTPEMVKQKGQFQQWLKQDKPQVVLLSWGMLNSISGKNRIPMTQFLSDVHQEITDALQNHAVVLIITPPVTQWSTLNIHSKQEVWINALFKEAASFHSKNIYTIDLYHQMEAYLAAHGQTYKNYFGNSWHPDQAGHILGGELLANDLVQTFGTGPITWQN